MNCQIVLRSCGNKIGVSCTCLTSPRGRCRAMIEMRALFPAAEAIAAWRAWHAEQEIMV